MGTCIGHVCTNHTALCCEECNGSAMGLASKAKEAYHVLWGDWVKEMASMYPDTLTHQGHPSSTSMDATAQCWRTPWEHAPTLALLLTVPGQKWAGFAGLVSRARVMWLIEEARKGCTGKSSSPSGDSGH